MPRAVCPTSSIPRRVPPGVLYTTLTYRHRTAPGRPGVASRGKSSHRWGCASLFLSSTFRDFQPERDYLMKFVLPALQVRAECIAALAAVAAELPLHFVGRYGV